MALLPVPALMISFVTILLFWGTRTSHATGTCCMVAGFIPLNTMMLTVLKPGFWQKVALRCGELLDPQVIQRLRLVRNLTGSTNSLFAKAMISYPRHGLCLGWLMEVRYLQYLWDQGISRKPLIYSHHIYLMLLNRIMPPGTWHVVYTPVRTVATGGHLFTYDTLHMTEMSRMFDHKHGLEVTNTAHISAFDTLCLMTVNLIRLDNHGKSPS